MEADTEPDPLSLAEPMLRSHSVLFISYSHQDEDFVNRLVARLLEERVSIWWDRVDIKVGESLLEKIQGAIAEADYLAVVLSKASVQSAWCRQELNAGLMRQLMEKRVVVLPILIEPCEIPPFLQDKKYANFTEDFDAGFRELRQVIATRTDPTLGRNDADEYQTDYGMGWSVRDGRFVLEIDGVSFSKKQSYSVMTRISIVGNEVATRRYQQYAAADLKDVGMACVVASCEAVFDVPNAHVSLGDSTPVTVATTLLDPKTGMGYEASIWARRIGEATGTFVLYHFGAIFGEILRGIVATPRPLTNQQKAKLAEILSKPP